VLPIARCSSNILHKLHFKTHSSICSSNKLQFKKFQTGLLLQTAIILGLERFKSCTINILSTPKYLLNTNNRYLMMRLQCIQTQRTTIPCSKITTNLLLEYLSQLTTVRVQNQAAVVHLPLRPTLRIIIQLMDINLNISQTLSGVPRFLTIQVSNPR